MNKTQIESLLPWSPVDEVTGLRKSKPTQAFWSAWESNRATLVSSGVKLAKESGKWIASWHQKESQDSAPEPERIWSDEQKAIFEWFESGTGNLVVEAYAGCAKTSTAVAAFPKSNDARMLYCVFNKKNQIEAQGKISDPRIEVKTLHSLGFSYITRAWGRCKPDDDIEIERLKLLIGDNQPPEIIGAILKMVGFLKNCSVTVPTVDDATAECELRGIEVPEIEDWNHEKIAEVAVGIMELSMHKDDMGRISFNDMVWLPVVLNIVKPDYDLVLVDEAQDQSPVQLEMVSRASRGRICVIGDQKQCIYSFRGASHEGMENMRVKLNAATLGLTTTYRCPKAVVEIAKQFVPSYKAAPTAPEGTTDDIELHKVTEEAKPGHAILSRLNAPLMPLCLSLLRKGIPARIEGRDVGKALVGIIKSMKAKSVPDFINKVETWRDRMNTRNVSKKNGKSLMEQANDTADTLIALSDGLGSVREIEERILSLFQDSANCHTPAVVLSTVHKAKGLEWKRVFIIGNTFLKKRNRDEENIFYVAITRSQNHLTFIGGNPNVKDSTK
jgi:superfamily I DNA/RNA helicase